MPGARVCLSTPHCDEGSALPGGSQQRWSPAAPHLLRRGRALSCARAAGTGQVLSTRWAPSAREDGGVSGVSSSCGARGGFLPRHDEDLSHTLLGCQLIISAADHHPGTGCASVIAVIPMQLPPGDNSSQRPLLSTHTILGGQRACGCGFLQALTPPTLSVLQQCIYDPSTPSL